MNTFLKQKTITYNMKFKYLLFIFLFISTLGFGQTPIALLKYNGGGDWYANPTSLPNLVRFCKQELGANLDEEVATVEVGDESIFLYPFVHITGHGNIVFNNQEIQNLRNYLKGGGFLHISDNYGIDKYIRREMKKVFPNLDFEEIPYSHPIFHQVYDFNHGLPKIHEHDNKKAQAFGIFYEGRLICFYDYECDLGDGWEDPDVHHDSQEKHLEALRMGANIISFVFEQ